MKEKKKINFLIGASTAAHQVEGNNIYSDFWAMEQMQNSDFKEPSLQAVDHYHLYKKDIDLLAKAGLTAFRFSIEWARIEPKQGQFDKKEIEHYRDVLLYCHKKGVTPVVTMHHFSSPKWLIEQGGWEDERTIEAFTTYCAYVTKELGSLMHFVCTINEANMGLQLASMIKDMMKQMPADVQVGMNFPVSYDIEAKNAETLALFHTTQPNTFLSIRTLEGDQLIMRAHCSARKAMKESCPHLQVGITLSLYDLQADEGGEAYAQEEWEEEFIHYLPYIQEDDFFGLQNYTRKQIGEHGTIPVGERYPLTKMGYENYPDSLANVIRNVSSTLKKPILVTENGIDTDDDEERITFIHNVMQGIAACIQDGIPVLGYLHWSLLDNFEWQKGYGETFGLIGVDRDTQERYPKKSLSVLGSYQQRMIGDCDETNNME